MLPLTVRPIRPDDRLRVIANRNAFSDQTVYQRFHGPRPQLGKSALRRLTELEPGKEAALVALEGDRLVAVGRWVLDRQHEGRAEVALIVADAWQGRGLGSFLLRQLLHDAVNNGVRELGALVQRSNTGIYRLFGRTLGEPDERHPHGSTEVLVYYLPYGHTAEHPLEPEAIER